MSAMHVVFTPDVKQRGNSALAGCYTTGQINQLSLHIPALSKAIHPVPNDAQ